MLNWLKIIINPDILGVFDEFPRFSTSCISFITTPTVKTYYKRESWDGGKIYKELQPYTSNFLIAMQALISPYF